MLVHRKNNSNATISYRKRSGLMDGLKKTFGKASQAISEKVSNNAGIVNKM